MLSMAVGNCCSRKLSSRILPSTLKHPIRPYTLPPPVVTIQTHKPPNMKACILGANGSIGQPLSLLMKHSTILTDLHLYDLQGALGLATDLGHIETRVKVKGFVGTNQLNEALKDCDIVLCAAGTSRKVYMSRDDQFKTNAAVCYDLMLACAEACPKAIIAIITNPINSIMPVAAEVLKMKGVFDPNRLFGVTTLDAVRANTFIAEMKKVDPGHVNCPVIGGHSGGTVIPLLSQCSPKFDWTIDEAVKITELVQEAGTEVLKAKAGAGSATVSMAYAGARFAFSMMRAMRGEQGIKECAYIKTDAEEAPYFTTPLIMGPNGYEKNLGTGALSVFEKELLTRALPELRKSIEKGEKFAKEKSKDCN